MVDIVYLALALGEVQQVLHDRDDVAAGEDMQARVHVEAELLVDHVAADAREVVLLDIEEVGAQQGLGAVENGRIAGADLAVDVQQALLGGMGVVVGQGHADLVGHDDDVELLAAQAQDLLGLPLVDHAEVVNDDFPVLADHAVEREVLVMGLQPRGGVLVPPGQRGDQVLDGHALARAEAAQNLLVGAGRRGQRVVDVALQVVEGSQERGHRELARLGDLDADHAARRRVDLHPGPVVGDHLRRVEHAARGVDRVAEVDRRRARELADDHALRPVDEEGAPLGHLRDLAHVHLELLDLTGLLVDQADLGVQRRLKGCVPLAALGDAPLRFADTVVEELEGDVAGIVFDRREVVEELAQAVSDEPVVRRRLDLDQIGQLDDIRALAPRFEHNIGHPRCGGHIQRDASYRRCSGLVSLLTPRRGEQWGSFPDNTKGPTSRWQGVIESCGVVEVVGLAGFDHDPCKHQEC